MSDLVTLRKRSKSVATTPSLRARQRARALTIENLEERIVLSTVTWNNRVVGDGLFTTASNWLGGVAPGANDDAVINLAPGTVTFPASGNVSVHSLSTNSTTTLVIAGGTLNVNSASTLGPLVVSGGTLGGSGALTLTNTLSWTGGTMTGPATTEVKGAITLGNGTGTAGSTLSLAGGRSLAIDTTATGSPNGAALTLNVGGGSTITNKVGASLTFTSNTSVVAVGTPPAGTIVNQGTLSTNGGTGTTSIGIPIINSGIVQAQTGTLIMGVGSTFSSTTQLMASAGAILNFVPATYVIPAGATATGAGGLVVNGATISYSGTFGLTGLTQIDGGELDFNVPTTVGSLLVTGGTLGGTGAVVVNGQTTWTGGTITGASSIEAKAGLALGFATGTSASTLNLSGGRSLINDAAAAGAANGIALTLNVSGGSTITNKAGATFTFTSNGSIVNNGGSPAGGTFVNQGTLGSNGGAGTTTIGIPITNTGTIQAQTGTFVIGAGSTFSSTSQLASSAGAILNFAAGTYAIPAGATVSGAGGFLVNGATITEAGTYNLTGLTQIDSGELDFNAAATLGSLLVNGGVLGGTGAVTVSGQTTWTGGTITGASSIEAVGGLKLGFATGNTASTLNLAGGRSLINDAAATGPANGAPLNLNLADGSSITNKTGATFTFTTNSSIANNGGSPPGGTFINQGTLGTNGGTGTTVFGTPIINSGTLQALTGTIQISSGSTFSSTTQLKASAGATLNFAFSTFTIPAGATTTGAGKLLVNGATVNYAGTYNLTGLTQIDSGELDFNAAATLGSLTLTGGTLGGTGAVVVTGATVWNGGTMTGAGSTEAKAGLTLGFTTGSTQATLALAGRSLINDAVANAGSNGAGIVLNVSGGSILTNKAGATINVLSNSSIANNGGVPAGGTFSNAGNFVVNGGLGTTTIGVTVTNSGTLSVQTGALDLTGTFTNFNSVTSTLTGGAYTVKGFLDFANAKIVTNKATITLTASTAGIRDLTFADALSGLTANPSGGKLALQGGKTLTVPSFTNGGSLSLTSGTVFTSTGAFVSTGTVSLTSATLTSTAGGVTLNGGSLSASGTINGNLTVNSGSVLPGGAASGLLTVNGNYTQGATTTLSIDIGGTTAGSKYDRLAVTGIASLNGTLSTGLISSYVPTAGLTFRPLTFASKTGDFSTKSGLNLGSAVLSTVYDATGLNLVDNVAPTVPAVTSTINAGGTANITLAATDPETAAASLVFTIASLPATGTLTTTGGTPVTVGQTFTGSPVALVYQTPNFIFGNFTSSFGFTVSDTGTPIGVVATTASTVNLSLASPSAGVASIFGAPGNDTILAANSGGNLQVTINGVVNNTGVPISSITQINVLGGNGNNTIELSGLAINATLTGGAGTNSLIVDGTSAADTFSLNSSTSVGLNGATITGTSPLTINGAGGNDIFNILAPNIAATINAGSGNDTFAVANGASITTPINGGGGTNTIDESAVTTAVALNVAASTVTGLSVPFANIQSVIGGANAANTLTGPAAGSTYNITGANTGNVGGITFSGFGNLVSGTNNDTFVFSNGATVSGSLSSAGGADTIDESAYTTPVVLGVDASTLTGIGTTFSGVQTLIGSAAAGGTINGPAAGTAYTINGVNAGTFNGLSFSKFTSIVAGAGNDVFNFIDGSSIAGNVDGGGGVNAINETDYSTAVALDLAASAVTGVGTTFANIQNFTGGSGSNTLTGPAAGSTFNITGANSGNVAGINFSQFGFLNGGGGNNTFVFTNNSAALTGTINGGAGTNTIDESAVTSTIVLNLPAFSITGLGSAFTNIETILGGTNGGNTLTGTSSNSTYNITAANAGNVGGFTFSGFGNITGGSGNDSFVFSPGATLSGVLNGGGGTNTIDESAVTTAIALNAGTSTVSGLTSPFSNIQTVIGGANAGNTLTGPAAASIYNITGANAGNVGGLTFSGFGNVVGGAGNDSFVFSNSATISGTLNGGAGTNTIDESASTTAIAANPSAGTITGVGGTYSNVQALIGSTTAGGTLTGPAAAATFNITGANAGNVGGTAFSNFTSLAGGAGNDIFKFSAGASLGGSIDGGAGTNTIDESAYTTPVALNLAASSLTGLGTTYANIQTITPGSGANTLTGPAAGSTFNITGANAGNVAGFNFTKFGALVGGAGNDVFKFTSGGSLTGGIDGGAGTNTIDESALTTQVTLNLATSTVSLVTGAFANIQSVLGGTNTTNQVLAQAAGTTFNITGANIGNAAGIGFTRFGYLVGGAGNDVFKFSNAATLSGTINGGAGTNTVDQSSYLSATSVNLSTSKVTAVGVSFASIQAFIAGTYSVNQITGPNAATVFNVTAANKETISGITFSGFGYLVGGTANDSFVFSLGASLTGSINGGTGTNTLDLSAFTKTITVNMSTSTVTGVGSTFSSIQTFIGGSNATNAVTGPATGTTFNITALNTFNANGLNFSSFRKIVGGAGEDSFVLSDGAGLSSTIDGGAGTNWLDYSAYTTGVTVNLATGAASGFGSATANIVNVRGGSGNDNLTGNSKGNILIGGGGADTLTGGTGVSLLIGGTGADIVNGGSGGDLIIGGSTSYDNNNAALDSILAEWQSADTYANRINFIKNGGGLNGTNVLNLGTTVIDDVAANVLTGAPGGKNWYFKGTSDNITNLQAGEQVN